jgi:leader peptidase (prepilin peptidase)/N-methyltransferase
VPLEAYPALFATFAFILGAGIGSFLNVCIYRLPLGLSVNEPKRSFCPHCKYQIPWHHNLPLFSWLALRGKCGNCGKPIPFRYFGVELLTAALFLGVWLGKPWLLALPYWIFVSLLVVATFIDFEHFIIPDEITWGGAIAGLVLSLALPQIMGVESNLLGLLWSFVGAAAGYFTLWGVVEAGKLAFGKKTFKLDPAQSFDWTRDGDDANLVVGEDTSLWSDLFARETDRLMIQCTGVEIDGKPVADTTLTFHYDRVLVAGNERPLKEIARLTASATQLTMPREAMGFGDVKFIACIGAFLGWQAVFFTIASASMVGAIIGGGAILITRGKAPAKIPFGPYLALGALLWLFSGPQLVAWYLNLLAPK